MEAELRSYDRCGDRRRDAIRPSTHAEQKRRRLRHSRTTKARPSAGLYLAKVISPDDVIGRINYTVVVPIGNGSIVYAAPRRAERCSPYVVIDGVHNHVLVVVTRKTTPEASTTIRPRLRSLSSTRLRPIEGQRPSCR